MVLNTLVELTTLLSSQLNHNGKEIGVMNHWHNKLDPLARVVALQLFSLV